MEQKGQNRIQEDTDKRGKVIWDDFCRGETEEECLEEGRRREDEPTKKGTKRK
jgi:hypothetical protein